MHEALLASLLRAPMSFYHTTPTGRIINRLTKDTSDIDRNLAGNLGFAFRSVRGWWCLGALPPSAAVITMSLSRTRWTNAQAITDFSWSFPSRIVWPNHCRASLQLMSTVILIGVGAPFALPALLVMLGVFYWLYRYFMASVRQAKRLEAVSRCAHGWMSRRGIADDCG
jgi:ABC-type multidrug transport system fused ATPase/permease subunit